MKFKLKPSKRFAYAIPAFIAGTVLSGSVAMAATNYIQAQRLSNSSVSVNGQNVGTTPRFVSNNTTFLGLWWLQGALKKAGILTNWDGNKFSVTLPQTQSYTPSALPAVSGFHVSAFAQGTSSMTNPDDITMMNNRIYVAYQDGVGSKGEASKSGVTSSTVVAYDKNGQVVEKWTIVGKCDGMTADPTNNRIIATVNEDGNSSMYIMAQGKSAPQHITYSPNPATAKSGAMATGGGTDSIAVHNGNVYLSASAPAPDSNGNFTHAALFKATIQGNTATLTPALMGNATATDVTTGKNVTLNLSDPDSSTIVPSVSPKFAGDFMLDSQGDSQLLFVQNLGSADQSVSKLPLGTQVDDVAWATSSTGTLYVSDSSANKVYVISVHTKPGTAFVSCASDSGVGNFIGEFDLSTGNITPVVMGLNSHGMIFVPGN